VYIGWGVDSQERVTKNGKIWRSGCGEREVCRGILGKMSEVNVNDNGVKGKDKIHRREEGMMQVERAQRANEMTLPQKVKYACTLQYEERWGRVDRRYKPLSSRSRTHQRHVSESLSSSLARVSPHRFS
jgi:hypothetical protein